MSDDFIQGDNKGGAWGEAPGEADKQRKQALIRANQMRFAAAPQGAGGHGFQAAQAQAFGQHPMAAAHFGAHQDMIGATNDAWAREMDSRRGQAEADRDRQHEYDMESLKQQSASQARGQQEAAALQAEQARKARNASLLGAAGLGGYTLHIDGAGNTSFNGMSPIGRSLLGD